MEYKRFARRISLSCISVVSSMLAALPAAAAEKDALRSSLTICSQNLHMLGRPAAKQKYKRYKTKLDQTESLVARINAARCDVVALQEVYGKSDREANKNALVLVQKLSQQAGRKFKFILARTNDNFIRNGFVIADDIGTHEDIEHFNKQLVPRMAEKGRAKRFHRGPAGVFINAQPVKSRPSKSFYILTYHLKSKSDGWKDPSKTAFEIDRAESAEAIREIFLAKDREKGESTTIVALGDRNSDSEDAASSVLSGELRLTDFRGPCEITKDLVASCSVKPRNTIEAIGLFAELARKRGTTYSSYQYKKEKMLYDEIYVEPEDSKGMFETPARIEVGSEGDFKYGSDHLLMWVRFHW